MRNDWLIRRALQVTAPFNLLAGFALAYPASWAGQVFGLPADAPAVYRALTGGIIALFGFVYGWLSMQPRIDRPLVMVSACGKLLAFGTLLALTLTGELPLRSAVLGSGDLAFALVFLHWWKGTGDEPR
jgi:hypothetical protein